MKTLITVLAFLVVAFVAIAMVQGWIHFTKHPDKATIEIETHEMGQAADQAKKEGKELLKEAGKSLEHGRQQLEESLHKMDSNANNNPDSASPPVEHSQQPSLQKSE